MGKRTSDFVALATILGGLGVGYGVTMSLFPGNAPVAQVIEVSVGDVSVDDVSVEGRVLVRDGRVVSTIYFRGRPGAKGPTWSPSGERLRFEGEVRRLEGWAIGGAGRADLVWRESEVAELRKELERETQELSVEALEELDCLEAAAQSDEDEDQRRRRRRRRPCR